MLKSGRRGAKLSIVHSGKEPATFRSYFAGWDDEKVKLQHNPEFVDPREARLEKMREEGKLGDIYKFRGKVLSDTEANEFWQQDNDLVDAAEQLVDPNAPPQLDPKKSRPAYRLGDMSVRTAMRRGQGTDVVQRAEEKFEARRQQKRMAQKEAEMLAHITVRSGDGSHSPRSRSPRA